jgi:iron complex transport system substrate-binding protein
MKHHRIVSLLPSATEIVCALNLEKNLVGRSHECDFPDQVSKLPATTHTSIDPQASSAEIDRQVNALMQRALSPYRVDYEKLSALRPTHILTQDLCKACAIDFDDLQQALHQNIDSKPTILSLSPRTLDEVFDSIHQVAQALQYPTRAEKVIEECARRINHVRAVSADQVVRPRVACIEWLDPLMIAGHWTPDLLAACDAEAVLSPLNGQKSHKITIEQLRDANPDMILFIPCGFDLEKTRSEASALIQSEEWQKLTAVKIGNVFVADGNQYFNRPGPRLADSTEILANILYPNLFDFEYEGKAWMHLD